MYNLDQFPEILTELILKHDFQMPIGFTMIGMNGHIFAGGFEHPMTIEKPRFAIVTGETAKLRFPINALLVDSVGKAAHVFFAGPKEAALLKSLQAGQGKAMEAKGPDQRDDEKAIGEILKRLTGIMDLFKQVGNGAIGFEEFILKAGRISDELNKESGKMQRRIDEANKRLLN